MKLAKNNRVRKGKNFQFRNLMLLHWTMFPLFLLLFWTGVFVSRLPDEYNIANVFPFLHQSFGILIIILLIARFFLLLRWIWHRYSKSSFPNLIWLRKLALHIGLYFFMFVVPISGLLLRNARGIDTTFFGSLVSPLISENNLVAKILEESHFWTAYLFLGFIVLHIFANRKFINKF